MKRREFLKLSMFASVFLTSGCGASQNTKKMASGYKPLIIPPLIKGEDKNGIIHYDMSVDENTHVFFDGYQTKTYGINTSYLGATIKLINNTNVSINYKNNLQEPITMHGHGMHVPASQDGTAHQKILPNTSWSAKYKVNQKACTNWYHSHLMEKTAEQVYKGLAGLIIIEDEQIQTLNLPNNYGVDDIPLIVQDRFFDNNAQLYYNPNMRQIMMGYIGNTNITNGVVNPYINVQAKQIRFRILNGSNSSIYNLALSDDTTFYQIGCDNSLLEKPVELYNLVLSPGERAEILVDCSDLLDESLVLYDKKTNKAFLKIIVDKPYNEDTNIPETLTTLLKYDITQATKTRNFVLEGQMGRLYINGVSMDMSVINEKVPLNQIEIWEIKNNMMMTHNFHIHATHFMIIKRNGNTNEVKQNEKGYKDTVMIPSNQSVTVIVKMTDYKDESTPYMYHCHFLEHEDAGMMGQFTVV